MSGLAFFSISIASACSSLFTRLAFGCSIQISPDGIFRSSLCWSAKVFLTSRTTPSEISPPYSCFTVTLSPSASSLSKVTVQFWLLVVCRTLTVFSSFPPAIRSTMTWTVKSSFFLFLPLYPIDNFPETVLSPIDTWLTFGFAAARTGCPIISGPISRPSPAWVFALAGALFSGAALVISLAGAAVSTGCTLVLGCSAGVPSCKSSACTKEGAESMKLKAQNRVTTSSLLRKLADRWIAPPDFSADKVPGWLLKLSIGPSRNLRLLMTIA